MRILSISNEKGGVGKTIFAANLAWELSRMGYLVVTIDLDQQIDLTKLLYREEMTGSPDINDVLQGKSSINDACVMVNENLYHIPGSRDIKYFDFKNSEMLLKQALQAEDLDIVDIVIIDYPPSSNEATLLGYVATTDVLIITDTEEFSVDNIGNILDDLAIIKETMNPDLKVLGVVVNRVDKRRKLTQISLKELRLILGDKLFRTQISNNTAIPNSVRAKKTVRELGWCTPVLSQFKKIAKEVEERMVLKHGDGQTEGNK